MKEPATLVAEVRRFMANAGAGAGVVAVSGGPDSVALLRALAELRGEGAIGTLVIAHLNHQLRGAESDADEGFVRDLCFALASDPAESMRWRSERLDVAARAQELGDNLESVARRLRYDWLGSVAIEAGAAWVATGHTGDDQAETVLHHLLRGTGLKGLAGIPRRRPLIPGVELIRPLLGVRRQDVLTYLEALGQPYRVDTSNADERYTRNRIRRELLPYLQALYNPAIISVLCRLSEQAAEAQHSEEEAAALLLRHAELPRAGAILVLDRTRLGGASRHQVREALRLLWAREGWPLRAMGFREWDRAAGVVLGEATAIDLPGGIRVRRRGGIVQVEAQ